MIKQLILYTAMAAGFTGCAGNNSTVSMEDIAAEVSGVAFTKAVNGAEKCFEVGDDAITIDAASGSNYFISPDGDRAEATAPILLTAIDNRKPFTFTTRVESDIEKIYDAATLYIFVDNENWLKFAFECDEKFRNRVVTVRTTGTSDDNNHDIIPFDDVWLRISSNGRQIGFYYSRDGEDWNLARIFRNDYPDAIWLGLSSQSPKEGHNTARFTKLTLTEGYISNHRLGQ